jgi:hypothetical protein
VCPFTGGCGQCDCVGARRSAGGGRRGSERGLDFAWRREVLKASVRALLSVACYRQGERVNGNRNQQNSLSTMEPGKVEIGADILLS